MSSPSNRKTGHVKFFNSQKGFGFIIPNEPIEGEAQAEIFVHHTSIYNNGGFRSLAEGEEVEFDLVQGPKGLQATSVTGPNGGPVKGDPRAGRSKQGFNQQFGNQYAPNGQFFYSPQFQNQNQQAFTTQNTNQYIQATQAGYNQYPTNMNMNSMNTMNVMNAMNTMNTMNTMTNMSAMNAMNNMNTQTQ
ncbi:CSD-domain-containing protein [Neocallimastix californiae]|uniref:CSD-domain-containing protein n=1 Tax=Neocallimastix californiae TaxID=1754190 RepID=A0A1Y2EUG9_9FUNG|nr:CSD-domain-containing protein [Neocallimastix californiae]|eukprot:ORY75222.1 CSD-domain-containing protein [Neocallimastix californiae]